ncbi:TPA: hypothetical protein DCE37_09405, partial [Candidatus Latescibacteria bacterium]|nr:hypothetical protein [Candidatus Latescibacterota bacterium]
ARSLFAVSALIDAAAKAAITAWATGIESALVLRFLTNAALAGVYQPGMKIMASWFREERWMAIGVLVGAPSAGSAGPHLLRIVGSPGWQAVMWTASAYSALAALICLLFVKDGPHLARGARFDWRYAGRAFTDRVSVWRISDTLVTHGSSTPSGRGSQCFCFRASPTRGWNRLKVWRRSPPLPLSRRVAEKRDRRDSGGSTRSDHDHDCVPGDQRNVLSDRGTALGGRPLDPDRVLHTVGVHGRRGLNPVLSERNRTRGSGVCRYRSDPSGLRRIPADTRFDPTHPDCPGAPVLAIDIQYAGSRPRLRHLVDVAIETLPLPPCPGWRGAQRDHLKHPQLSQTGQGVKKRFERSAHAAERRREPV